MTLFITFEGGEGCGKSVQSKALHRKLNSLTIPNILIHEPGGTPLGEKIRYLLKHSCKISVLPLSELLLFNASRSQLVRDIIQPNLNQGKIVICDRFMDSTIAYQSYGRGLDSALVSAVNKIASQGIEPDLTILLDMPPEVGLSRKKSNANDRFEKEALAFHQRVRDGFLKISAENPGRWIIIDATLPRQEIGKLIWNKVSKLII